MHGMHGHGVTHFDERPAAVQLSKGRRRAVLAVVCLALALVMGMAVSLSVALPDMAREIGATQAQLQWIVNAYAVVFAGLLLPVGALERVMNLGENRIEMRIPQSAWFPRNLRFPHS